MTEQKTEVEILVDAIKGAVYFLDSPEIPHNEVDMSMSIALKKALAEAEKAVRTFTIEEVEELLAWATSSMIGGYSNLFLESDNWQQKKKELLGGKNDI